MIYFVLNPLNNAVKIGRASLPMAKVANLRKQCGGVDFSLMGVIPAENDKLLEYQLEKRFKASRLGYGWFSLNETLKDYINRHAVEYHEPADKWKTVRLPVTLYNWLSQHKEETGVPIATAVRIAVEKYKHTNGSKKLE